MSKKMKFTATLVAFALIVAALAPLPAAYAALGDKTVALRMGSSLALVNGQALSIDKNNPSVIPFKRGGEVYVPIRFIAEGLGGKVTSSAKNAYMVTIGNKKTTMTVGSSALDINGVSARMKAPSVISDDRLFVPVSAIADITGYKLYNENGLIVIYSGSNPVTDKSAQSALLAQLSLIPTFASGAEYIEYLKKMREEEAEREAERYRYYDYGIMPAVEESAMPRTAMEADSAVNQSADSSALAGGEAGSSDFSTVNIQVEGVDEADIIRTDGKYIYALNPGGLYIIDAYPADKMEVSAFVPFDNNPLELYADKDRLVVIASDYGSRSNNYTSSTKVMVFNTTNKKNPNLEKEFSLTGNYHTSRKINNYVYLLANDYTYYYNENPTPPYYYDGGRKTDIPAPCIYVLPGRDYTNTTIMGIDLNNLESEPFVSRYLGTGGTVYVSQKSMYIAQQAYGDYIGITTNIMPWLGDAFLPNSYNTAIHKFNLNEGSVNYVGSGAVPGYALNQFSMDEFENHFRIATNSGNSNNVYILDSQMKVKSKIENIAPGERIYSVRFMGQKGYMVTFKTVDPLFVIDLNPSNPKILGELKIPGYSDYLHPYDENHLIGFGKDAVEHRGIAYQQGVKAAIFDVSDVNNPKELHSIIIGGRGTESPLLQDHKALLFDKSKNLLAFPISVYEGGDGITGYGTFKFQGAYIYDISLDKGFVKRGEITHLTAAERRAAERNGWYGYGMDNSIKRILYIGDSLYTLSDRVLDAHNIKTIEQVNRINLDR